MINKTLYKLKILIIRHNLIWNEKDIKLNSSSVTWVIFLYHYFKT